MAGGGEGGWREVGKGGRMGTAIIVSKIKLKFLSTQLIAHTNGNENMSTVTATINK